MELTGAVSAGGLVVDLDTYTVSLDGRDVPLSPRQVELLALFVAAPRKVWSRAQLQRDLLGRLDAVAPGRRPALPAARGYRTGPVPQRP